jgi:hypothetical protein
VIGQVSPPPARHVGASSADSALIAASAIAHLPPPDVAVTADRDETVPDERVV